MKRSGNALWNGPGKTGKGVMSTASGNLNSAPYSYSSRFEQETGTNPEELIAAAHAGCFSMKLSFILGKAGFEPTSIATTCTVTFEEGWIKASHLQCKATVPGITEEDFANCVKEAKETCPVSMSLKSAISVEFTLEK
jgi:lipoyl-dependent peroxiredoxin